MDLHVALALCRREMRANTAARLQQNRTPLTINGRFFYRTEFPHRPIPRTYARLPRGAMWLGGQKSLPQIHLVALFAPNFSAKPNDL
jgi:hypothetical protein